MGSWGDHREFKRSPATEICAVDIHLKKSQHNEINDIHMAAITGRVADYLFLFAANLHKIQT